MPVNHLLFGRDPCPGTTKYLHVDYKCKPSEFSAALKTLTSSPAFPNPYFPSVITTVSSLPFDALSPHSAEHKRHVVCEGETMVLRCKPPRVLNIYAAVYGRGLAEPDICPSHLTRPPPFECLNHEAVHVVSRSCYSKQRCVVAVSNQTFRDPCFPGTRKYLTVLFACVPQTLLREADPGIFSSPLPPTLVIEKGKVIMSIAATANLFWSIGLS
uniref:SUEL-type lectin domain-containing protein n=1 Tax=Myripristis murdjan TaxID=586833 RepID=A0A667YZA1_9TELE